VFAASLILTLASLTGAQPADARDLVAAIRTAYEHNRAALSASGTIHFQCCDGNLDPAQTIEGIDASLKASWTRRSPSQGLYVFDGAYRRYENLYSPEQLVSRRTKLSPTQYQSHIISDRLLTDGETTLVDRDDVSADDKTVRYSPSLRAGTQHFYRIGEGIPLQLGNPDPMDYDLGKCLAKIIDGREKAFVAEVDEAATLDGVRVVKIRAELPSHENKLQITFWVDLQHGAIPLQTRVMGFIKHLDSYAVLQFSNSDIKWVGRGWLPFRFSAAQGDVSSTGQVASMFVREFVITDAAFDKRPERAMFALEFPTERGVSDSDRMLGFGRRRVWDVKDFSPEARARARRIVASSPGPAPDMPDAPHPWLWWPAVLVLIGVASLLSAGGLWFRKGLRHA